MQAEDHLDRINVRRFAGLCGLLERMHEGVQVGQVVVRALMDEWPPCDHGLTTGTRPRPFLTARAFRKVLPSARLAISSFASGSAPAIRPVSRYSLELWRPPGCGRRMRSIIPSFSRRSSSPVKPRARIRHNGDPVEPPPGTLAADASVEQERDGVEMSAAIWCPE